MTGSVGNCNVPTSAGGVAMNVTIANPTANSFLRIYPADVAGSQVSSLNWIGGQAPTPNKVDVKLPSDGKIILFNNSGTVDVLADVVGYYRSADLVGITSRLGVVEAVSAGGTAADFVALADDEVAEVLSLEVDAPVAGTVVVDASGTASDMLASAKVFCSITTGSTVEGPVQAWESAGPDGSNGQAAFVNTPTMTYVFVPD